MRPSMDCPKCHSGASTQAYRPYKSDLRECYQCHTVYARPVLRIETNPNSMWYGFSRPVQPNNSRATARARGAK